MVMVSYEAVLRVNAEQRLITVSQREGIIYKSAAYRRCGKGLTEAQFDQIVQGLATEEDPWLVIKKGPLGAEVLIYLDPWGDNLRKYATG